VRLQDLVNSCLRTMFSVSCSDSLCNSLLSGWEGYKVVSWGLCLLRSVSGSYCFCMYLAACSCRLGRLVLDCMYV
jgi:hypothetical protein